MLKRLLVVFCFSMSASVLAQDIATREQVLAFCKLQTYDSEKQKCFSQTTGKDYAVNILEFCKVLNYDSERLSCIEKFEGKEYSQADVDFCSGQTYDSEKVKCLSSAASTPIDSNQHVDRFCTRPVLDARLAQISGFLQSRDYGLAEKSLAKLRKDIAQYCR